MDEEMNDVLNPSDDEKEEDEYVLFTQQDNAKAETKSVSNGDVVSEHEESTHTHLRTVINTEQNTQGSTESSSEEDNNSAQPDQVQVQFHDVLKDYVGDFGFYQILYTLHKSWSTCLACMYTLVTVFLAAVPEHRCDLRDSARAGFNCTEEQLFATFIPNEKRHGQILPSQCQYYNFSALSYNFSDVSISLDQCTMGNMSDLLPLVDCDKWKYDTSFYKSTIIDEWDLVCSRSDLAANANSVYWFGVMAGLLVGGHIADRYGRKPVGIIGYIFFLLFGIVSSFSPSYTVFLVLRFLAAMFKTWKEVGGGIAALEIIGESRRIIYFLFDHIGWCIGYFLMDLIAYYERRWRYLHMYIVLSDVIAFLLFTFYFRESPRWLVTQGKQEEALKELKIVAKRNRRLIPTNISLSLQKEKVKVNVIELFRWPNLRKVTLMLFYVWIAMGFTYYGISLHTGHLGGNNFVTFFISGMTDLISGFLAIWLYHRYGRVRPYGFGCIAGGVALVVSIFVPTDLSWVIITTAMVGKFLVNIPGTGTWLYTLETYPTSIRSIGVHTCSFAARVGAVGASYIGILAKINRTLPLLIFGVCSILSGIISLMLPETRGEPLKQTVEEGELFVKRNLCKSFPCYHRCRRGESTEYNLIQNLNKTKDETVERDALLSSEDDF